MNNLSKTEFVAYFINFSAQTSANQVQDIFMSKLDRRRKGVFGPPALKKAVFFVDDMNMPQREKYGAQPPIELLRTFMDHGYWYDKKDTTSFNLVDIQLVSAMGPPGGGRNPVTPPFVKEAANNLLPTPAKSHYVFNLRDFSRVILGCCLIRKSEMESKRLFLRLWVHETMRVFYDRLIDDKDRKWLVEAIKSCVKDIFKENFDSVFEHLGHDGNTKISEEDLRNLIFGDFMHPDLTIEERYYEEIKMIDSMYSIVEQSLEEYNNTHKNKMELVIFRFFFEFFIFESFILNEPQ